MPQYLVENFASGLDLRRSIETAPPGTVRLLRNAFINEGGEIEKRKAFVLEPTLTAYAQTYKGRVTGPHEVPGYPNSAMFRHRQDALPGSPWAAGAGSLSKKFTVGSGPDQMTFWASKSTAATTNLGALLHTTSYSQFANKGYAVESWLDSVSILFRRQHVSVTFTSGEPTSEAVVTANDGRGFQMTLDDKGYVIDGNTLYFSATADPATMSGTGSGNINITTKGQPIGGGIALGDYFGQLAIFGRRGVQFYSVDPDPAQNAYERTVTASLYAARSVTGYGDGDIVYLGRNGVRSLQARDSSNLAAVSDVGSPIDRGIRAVLKRGSIGAEHVIDPGSAEVPLSDYLSMAAGAVLPDTGQLWMAIGPQIWCMTRHPAAKVQAWCTYDLPIAASMRESLTAGSRKSSWLADIAQVGETLVFRNFADEVFIYGGADGVSYDASKVEVILPFLDMGQPGTNKYFTGIDMVCEGEWEVFACAVAVADEQNMPWTKIAELTGRTRQQTRVGFDMQGTQIALRFISRSAYAARIAQVGVFYEPGAQK